MECVSEMVVQERIGHVAGSSLAHRLRRSLRDSGFDVQIKCMRGFGYWITDDAKRALAATPELRVVIQDAAEAINEKAMNINVNASH